MAIHTNSLMVTGSAHISGTLDIGGAVVSHVYDEDEMSSNSATGLATQQSIKAYVDSSATAAIGDIGDVTVTSAAAGQVLSYDATGNEWANASITGTTNQVSVSLADSSIQVGLPTNVTIDGDLTVSGGDIIGGTGNLNIKSNHHIVLDLDEDNNGSANLYLKDGAENVVMTVSESGDMTLGGALTVEGNIIKASDGGTTITMDTSDNVTVGGDLTVGGGDIYGPENSQLRLRSDANIILQMDGDGDGTNKFVVWNQSESPKFEVDESGNTRAYGTLRVDGNQILASDGGTSITLDASDNVTVGNNLTVGGNIIKNSQSENTITMDVDQNVTIAGDLQVGSHIIKNSSGEETITLDGDQKVGIGPDPGGSFPSYMLDVNGDIRVRGNDIRDSSAGVAIKFDGSANTQVVGDLVVGEGTAADQKIVFDGNAQDFHIGIDDTDDELKIGAGSSPGTGVAISITSGSYVQLTKGNKFSPSVAVITEGSSSSKGKYVKLAEHTDGLSYGNYDGTAATFLVVFTGLGLSTYDILQSFIVHVQWSENSGIVGAQSPATHVSVQHLDYYLQSDSSSQVDLLSAEDFTLTYNGVTKAELWAKCPVQYGRVSVTHLGGTAANPTHTGSSHGTGYGWKVCTSEDVNPWQTTSGSLGADKVGELAKKKFQSIELSGTSVYATSIRDEDTMSSNDAYALATQQSIKAYVDNSSISLSNGSDNRVVTSTNSDSLNAESNLTFDASVLEITNGSGEAKLVVDTNSTTANHAGHIMLRKSDTGGLAAADNLGEIFFAGSEDGSTFNNAAAIIAEVDEAAWTANSSAAGKIILKTTPDGSTSPTDALKVDSTQKTTMYGDADINGVLAIIPPNGAGANTMGYLRFHEESINGANYLQLQVDAHVGASDIVVEIPAHNGSLINSGDSGSQSVAGNFTVSGDLFVNDYARIDALRVGTTSTDPGDGNLVVENQLLVNNPANNIGIAAVRCEDTTNTGGFSVVDSSSSSTTRIWHDGDGNRRIDGGTGNGTLYINKTMTGVGIHVGGEVRVQHASGQADFVSRATPSAGVGNGDNFGGLYFYGSEDDTSFTGIGGLLVEAAQDNWNGGNSGSTKTLLKFWCNNGSGTDEILYIDGASGAARVGIGNNEPTYQLDVKDNRTSWVTRFWNDGNDTTRYGIRIQAGADNAAGTNYAIAIADGDGTAIGYATFSGSTVTWGAFTGVHPAFIEESGSPVSTETALVDHDDPNSGVDMITWYPRGTLVKTNSTSYQGAEGTSNVLYRATKTTTSKDKSVLGIYLSPHRPDQWRDLHDIACVGDGEILMCSEGGNLEIGDYICSSNTPGHGMKQDDDLLHNYTVAKSLENVNWDELGVTEKLVKCTFHAG